MEQRPAPMWRMPTLGVTSEDFINQKNQSNPRAFYNKMWRFGKDTDYREDLKKRRAEEESEAAKKRSLAPPPLDNHLVDEARQKGLPISQPDTDQTPEGLATSAQAAKDLADAVRPKFTESQLKELPKEQLVEMAAALGIANTALPKPKLIEAILEKNS